jgi:hypothetical protein
MRTPLARRPWIPASLLALLGLAFVGNSCATEADVISPGRLWTYQYLLATAQSQRQLAPIAEHMIDEETLDDPRLVDVAAEVLLARADDADFPFQNKRRLVNVLGAMKTPRYNALLTRVAESTHDERLAKDARSAILKNKTGEAEYVPGSVDLGKIVADMDAAALAARPTTEQGKHLAQFPGGSIDDLIAWAGKPQQIVIGQTRVTDGLINVKIQRLTYFYRGLGRVVFGYSTGKFIHSKVGWLFQAVVADPLAFEQEFTYRARAQQLGLPDTPTLEMMQLVSGYTAAMKVSLQTNYNRETRPLEYMDTAAEILATQFDKSDDPVVIDTHAWICRILSQHGGQRYAAILAQVAADAPDRKLRRYADLFIEPTTEVPATPYVPGTISLDTQRAKFPSPYPESTFQYGQL